MLVTCLVARLADVCASCRYTGSDISIVVRDALMQPVRKVISATHFKPLASPSDSPRGKVQWTPCSPGDPQAVEKSWNDVESDELQEPPLLVQDFVRSVESIRPTVTEMDIRRHDDWTMESGEFESRWPVHGSDHLVCVAGNDGA